MAQPGRALGSGPRSRWFKSSRPDHFNGQQNPCICRGFSLFLRGLPQAPPVPRFPPCRRLPSIGAALPRRYAGPSLRFASLGDSRPRFGHGPAADAAGRGLRRGRLSSPLARLRVELARGALARHAGLCPSGKAARVKIGVVLRGVLPRSSALRASGGGARVFFSSFSPMAKQACQKTGTREDY